MLKLILFSILLFSSSPALGDKGVLKLYGKFFNSLISKASNIDTIINGAGHVKTFFSLAFGIDEKENQEILDKLDVITNKIDSMDRRIMSKLESITDFLVHLKYYNEISPMERQIGNHIQTINTAFRVLHPIMLYWRNVPDSDMEKLRREYIKVEESLQTIQQLIAPDYGDIPRGLPYYVTNSTDITYTKNCIGTNIPHKQLYDTYDELMTAEKKAIAILALINRIKWPEDKQFLHAMAGVGRQFLDRQRAYTKNFLYGFNKITREILSCDPKKWEKGVTFLELDHFVQMVAYVPERRSWQKDCTNSIRKTISEGSRVCDLGFDEFEDEFCFPKRDLRCLGSVTECELKHGVSLNAKSYNDYSSRRLEDIYPGSVGEYRHHHYDNLCLCTCVEKNNKISLALSLSDSSNNRVITGMRLAYQNETVFIQIKQGKLGPKGAIQDNSNEWIPEFPDNNNVMIFDNINNGFNLDNVAGRDGEVLTGVGFEKARDNRIKLKIQATSFNFWTGFLNRVPLSRIVYASASNQQKLVVGNYNPVNASKEHRVNSSPEQYLTFQRSLYFNDRSDNGQTTLPYLDGVAVEAVPATPLIGVGLNHKGVDDSAGFLSLKALTLDFGQILRSDKDEFLK